MDYEQRYEDLHYEFARLKRCYEDLRQKHSVLEDKLSSAEFKIKTELEPRIKQEQRMYDKWVTNPER